MTIIALLYLGGVLGASTHAFHEYRYWNQDGDWRHILAMGVTWPLGLAAGLLELCGVLDWFDARVDRYRRFRQRGDEVFIAILFGFWPWPLVVITVVCLSVFGWVVWHAVTR